MPALYDRLMILGHGIVTIAPQEPPTCASVTPVGAVRCLFLGTHSGVIDQLGCDRAGTGQSLNPGGGHLAMPNRARWSVARRLESAPLYGWVTGQRKSLPGIRVTTTSPREPAWIP